MGTVRKRIDWLLGATIGLCWTMLALLGIALGALVLAMPALFVFQGNILAEIARKHPGVSAAELPWILAVLLGATAIVGLSFLFVKTLLAIVTSVAEGDPFTTENATRLERMGWYGIGVQAAGLATAAIGWRLAQLLPNVDMGRDFGVDLSGAVLILLLFVLARVFRVGAAMRADLEGTV
jgi:Protein of unknown function (DUF2975)